MYGATSASSFWAQKSDQVKTSTAPTPVFTTPPKQNRAAPEAKNRVVLKGKGSASSATPVTDRITGMANGTPVTSTPKKTDWADSDDDEDFLASFSAKKDPRIVSLENEVAQKDANIEALDAVVSMKAARIAELEGVIGGKALHIANLEMEVEKKDATVEKLKSENHTQFLYVQELVGEVDEKSRRIDKLETVLDDKCVRIRELEQDAADSSSQTQVSTEEFVKVELPEAAESGLTDTKDIKRAKTCNVQSDIPLEAGMATQDMNKLAANAPLLGSSPKKELRGPAVNESKFPKLWTPDMPKEVAPVEKPKVLKMAIDTSKFKKAPSLPVKKPESLDGKGFATPTYGQSTRHRAKTSVIPKFQVDKDIRHMSHAVRVLFANGPEIDVMLGTTHLMTLPKYIFMQCSEKAYRHFTDYPDATSITFPTGSMDTEAAKAHLQWMDEMTYQGRVYSLTLHADQKLDSKNLKICQAARVMGMNNTYIGHFTKVLCDRVRGSNASTDFLSLICELAYPANDPIFDCLANNLVNQQLSKGVENSEIVDKLRARYPSLKEQLDNIKQRVKDSRAGDKRKGVMARDGSHNRDGGWGQEGAKNKNIIG